MNVYEVLSYTVPTRPDMDEQRVVRVVEVERSIGYAEVEADFTRRFPNERVSGFNTLACAI